MRGATAGESAVYNAITSRRTVVRREGPEQCRGPMFVKGFSGSERQNPRVYVYIYIYIYLRERESDERRGTEKYYYCCSGDDHPLSPPHRRTLAPAQEFSVFVSSLRLCSATVWAPHRTMTLFFFFLFLVHYSTIIFTRCYCFVRVSFIRPWLSTTSRVTCRWKEHPENSHLHTVMRFHNVQRGR